MCCICEKASSSHKETCTVYKYIWHRQTKGRLYAKSMVKKCRPHNTFIIQSQYSFFWITWKGMEASWNEFITKIFHWKIIAHALCKGKGKPKNTQGINVRLSLLKLTTCEYKPNSQGQVLHKVLTCSEQNTNGQLCHVNNYLSMVFYNFYMWTQGYYLSSWISEDFKWMRNADPMVWVRHLCLFLVAVLTLQPTCYLSIQKFVCYRVGRHIAYSSWMK